MSQRPICSGSSSSVPDVREQQRPGNVCDHRVAVTLVQRVIVRSEPGHIDALVIDLELGQTGNHQDKTEADADNDRDRQIEHDRCTPW